MIQYRAWLSKLNLEIINTWEIAMCTFMYYLLKDFFEFSLFTFMFQDTSHYLNVSLLLTDLEGNVIYCI